DGALPAFDDDACPRIPTSALPGLARAMPELRTAGHGRLRMIAALVAPPIATALLALVGVSLGPLYALVPIVVAAGLSADRDAQPARAVSAAASAP
ncbi:hypothetical protein L6R52_25370, partial [Myxococcota bacterium]|nr:hypothetical protein [Myxococcota bacterium]